MCAKFRFSISSRSDDINAEVKGGGQLYALLQRLAGGAESQRLPGYLGVPSSCYIEQILVRAHFFSWYNSRVRTSQNEERFKISVGALLLLALL